MRVGRWNHNIHYHPLILSAVPDGCDRALDVGCGEGILARELNQSVPHVTAIDLDEQSLRLAREQDPAGRIDFAAGDFLTYPFEGSFDFIASVAAIDATRLTAVFKTPEVSQVSTIPRGVSGKRQARHAVFPGDTFNVTP